MTALMVEETNTAAAPWFVVITHVNQEKIAKYQLEQQGHAVYMPMVPPSPRARKRNGVPPSVRPMIPRYLFVQVDLDRPDWRAIYSTFGVHEVISSGLGEHRCPRAIPTRFIEEIKGREVGGLVILPEARKSGPAPVTSRFKKGDKLRWHGATADYDVVFQRMVDGNRAEVVFTLMGVDSLQTLSLPSED